MLRMKNFESSQSSTSGSLARLSGMLAAASILTAACGGAEDSTQERAVHAVDGTYELRGGVRLTLQHGTEINEDELVSREGYASTLTDTDGTKWFIRVELSSEESLASQGLRRFMLGERPVLLGASASAEGEECHVFLKAGSERFVALSRPADDAACPEQAGEVAPWLPLVELVSSGEDGVATAAQALSFGSWVGSFNGVDAYSNGSNLYDSGSYSCCGLKWQCVEYVNRYYVQALGHQNLKGTGHAKSYFGTAASKGLVAYTNTNAAPPAVNDMLASAGGAFGHIAIVREVGPDYVKVIHQNWSNTQSDNAKTLWMSFSNGKYTVSGFSANYPVQGWLRKGCSPFVSSVSPTTVSLNQPTTFTVTGSCMPPTLAVWIAECANLQMSSVTPSQAKFTCTPSYSTGIKSGVVKTQSGGALLKSFNVTVL
jgi:surface antigen